MYSVGTLGNTKMNKTDFLHLHAFQVSGTRRCIGNYRMIMPRVVQHQENQETGEVNYVIPTRG